jgi:hypothetical protein
MLKLSLLNATIVSFLAKPLSIHTSNINKAKKLDSISKSTQLRAFLLILVGSDQNALALN